MESKYNIYSGNEPYIFISYSHEDTHRVMPIINGLQEHGFRIWYDAGIEPSYIWSSSIAERINSCTCFMFFITQNYMDSTYCQNEIYYALKVKHEKHTIAILPIKLEDVKLESGLDLQLSAIHHLTFTSKTNPQQFLSNLVHTDILQTCRGNGPQPPTPPNLTPPKTIKLGIINQKWISIGVIGILCAIILITLIPKQNPAPPISSQNSEIDTSSTQTTENDLPSSEIQPPTGTLVSDQSVITKDKIQSVTFLSDLQTRPVTYWDVSDKWNSKTFFWAYENDGLYDVYYAADGGVVAPENCTYLFRDYSNMKTISFQGFDTSDVVLMEGMFRGCTNLNELHINDWNVSNVIKFYGMFSECSSLTSLDLSKWNVSSATDTSFMFNNCKTLTNLNLKNWNTSNITLMVGMFANCTNLTELHIDGWDVSNVTRTHNMFSCCSSLTSLDLSKWNVSSLSDVSFMFYNCTNLVSLNLDNWKTSKLTDLTCFLENCKKLSQINVNHFDTSNVIIMQGVFNKCAKLTDINITNWNTSNVTSMRVMFSDCLSLRDIDVSNFNMSKVKDIAGMFQLCPKLNIPDISNWDLSSVVEYNNFLDSNRLINGKPWKDYVESKIK